jgi:uncharacterized damage-inducible protein DinB
MLTEELIKMYELNLLKLKEEIKLYSDENKMWIIDKEIKNSGANLALHLVGNLKHFVGTILGKTDYVRDRDAEFSLKDIPKQDLINEIEETIEVIKNVLPSLSADDWDKTYPINVLGYEMTTRYFMIYLIGHLNYHLGQVNYHRRLLS